MAVVVWLPDVELVEDGDLGDLGKGRRVGFGNVQLYGFSFLGAVVTCLHLQWSYTRREQQYLPLSRTTCDIS